MEYREIGGRLKERRTELGMSATELADRLSMSKATIHRYENGEIKNIKLPVADLIARELRVNVLWLLGKSERKEIASGKEDDILVMMDALIEYVEQGTSLASGGRVLSREGRDIISAALKGVREFVNRIE